MLFTAEELGCGGGRWLVRYLGPFCYHSCFRHPCCFVSSVGLCPGGSVLSWLCVTVRGASASTPRAPQALLWSMRSYTLIRRLEGHQSSVVSCDFSPDSALLATASYDTCVIMWDPYTGEQLRTLRYGAGGRWGPQEWGREVSWGIGGAERGLGLRLGLFSPRSHVPLHSALDYSSDVHTSSLRSVCFSPEGLYLATVADDR